MKVTRDMILGALPQLDKADLAAVQALTMKLLNVASNSNEAGSGPQAWLYEALQVVSGSIYPRNIKLLHAPAFLGFVKLTFPKAEDRVMTLGIMRMLLGLLVDDLQSKNVPVTMATLASNLFRIPEIFDAAYPGYRDSGLVDLIMPVQGK